MSKHCQSRFGVESVTASLFQQLVLRAISDYQSPTPAPAHPGSAPCYRGVSGDTESTVSSRFGPRVSSPTPPDRYPWVVFYFEYGEDFEKT